MRCRWLVRRAAARARNSSWSGPPAPGRCRSRGYVCAYAGDTTALRLHAHDARPLPSPSALIQRRRSGCQRRAGSLGIRPNSAGRAGGPASAAGRSHTQRAIVPTVEGGRPQRRRSGGPKPAPTVARRTIAFDCAHGVCSPARARLLRHGSGLPRRERCPDAHIRARANTGSVQRTGRIRSSHFQTSGPRFSANYCPGAARRGLPLRPPSSEEARPRRSPGPGTRRNVWSNPRRSAQYMRQAIDRNHQNVMLDELDAPRTDEADDAEGAAACPSSPAS